MLQREKIPVGFAQGLGLGRKPQPFQMRRVVEQKAALKVFEENAVGQGVDQCLKKMMLVLERGFRSLAFRDLARQRGVHRGRCRATAEKLAEEVQHRLQELAGIVVRGIRPAGGEWAKVLKTQQAPARSLFPNPAVK